MLYRMKNIWNTNRNSQSPYAVQNVTGSGTDNDIVLFDGNSGKLIKDSTVPLYAHNDSFGIGTDFQKLGTTNNSCVSLGAYAMNNSQGAQNWISIGNNSSQLSIDPSNNIVLGFYGNNANLHGSWNTLIGNYAGLSYIDSENNNIILGNNYETAGENRSIYIGDGNQIRIIIPNIAYYNLNTSNCGFGTDFPNKDPGLLGCTAVGDACLRNVTTGAYNSTFGTVAMQFTTTGYQNCAFGYSSLRQLLTGHDNIAIGLFSRINYVSNESYNLLIGNPGVENDMNNIRIGDVQTKCFIKGIYGVTPAEATQSVIIDSNGQLGSVATSSAPTFESTTSTIAIDSPATMGNLTVYFSRINKSVNCVIAAKSHDFTGSPQNQINTLSGVIPTLYRPVENVLFPMIFKSNRVYDTGLVGNVIVSSAGAFLFSRDNDAAF
jgi:hypothetical protein